MTDNELEILETLWEEYQDEFEKWIDDQIIYEQAKVDRLMELRDAILSGGTK